MSRGITTVIFHEHVHAPPPRKEPWGIARKPIPVGSSLCPTEPSLCCSCKHTLPQILPKSSCGTYTKAAPSGERIPSRLKKSAPNPPFAFPSTEGGRNPKPSQNRQPKSTFFSCWLTHLQMNMDLDNPNFLVVSIHEIFELFTFSRGSENGQPRLMEEPAHPPPQLGGAPHFFGFFTLLCRGACAFSFTRTMGQRVEPLQVGAGPACGTVGGRQRAQSRVARCFQLLLV